jgi:hypothetical protein
LKNPTSPKPFAALRAVLVEFGVEQEYLGKAILHKSLSYVSHRFNNRAEWELADQYVILDNFGLPHEQMHRYFPKNGGIEPAARRGKSAK